MGSLSELRRQEYAKRQDLSVLKDKCSKVQSELVSVCGKDVVNSCGSVEKVRSIFLEKGGRYTDMAAHEYHGMLLEHLECDESMYAVVEAVAKNKLFNHIVKDDAVATEFIKEMNRQEIKGTSHFMPLANLRVGSVPLHDKRDDVVSLLDQLQCPEDFEKAFKIVFGRTLICRSLDVAIEVANNSRFNCVTLEGDLVSNRGSLTGGFRNPTKFRLQRGKDWMQLKASIREIEEELNAMQTMAQQVENEMNELVSQQQRNQSKRTKIAYLVQKTTADIQQMKRNRWELDHNRQPNECSLTKLQAGLDAMMATKRELESELKEDFLATLSVQEKKEVDQLNKDIQELMQEKTEAMAHRSQLQAEQGRLHLLLTEGLYLKKEKCMQTLQKVKMGDKEQEVLDKQILEEQVDSRLHEAAQECHKLNEKLAKLTEEAHRITEKLRSLSAKQKKILLEIEKDKENFEKLRSESRQQQEKLEELSASIAALGLINFDLVDSYKEQSTKHLFKNLARKNKDLKSYSDINLGEVDLYKKKKQEIEEVKAKKRDMDESYDKIVELMNVVEERKNDTIYKTFKQVSEYFTEIFQKLVPQGRAGLHINTSDRSQIIALSSDLEEARAMDQAGAEGQVHPDQEEARAMDQAGAQEQVHPDQEEARAMDQAGAEGQVHPDQEEARAMDQEEAEGQVHQQNGAQPAEPPIPQIKKWTGVGVHVSFSEKEPLVKNMQQLSGGQKSMVALAFIFAIQKCDTAPFYLFDEIDQAMDARYRTAVATMIKELSQDTQFFVTTFKPELLQHANKFYGVKYRNKVSHMECVSREEAEDFLKDNQMQG